LDRLITAFDGQASHARVREGMVNSCLGMKARSAAEILAHHDEPELWKGLLNHKSPDIRLKTLQYLTDRRDGKARQAINVSGGLVDAHTAYRDHKLAALSQGELEALDALIKD